MSTTDFIFLGSTCLFFIIVSAVSFYFGYATHNKIFSEMLKNGDCFLRDVDGKWFPYDPFQGKKG